MQYLYKISLIFSFKFQLEFQKEITQILSILNKEDENIVVLELICVDLIEQLKLTLILIERSKQMKPNLKQQFIDKKQSLLQLKNENEQQQQIVSLNFNF